jgi:hypothetical protein
MRCVASFLLYPDLSTLSLLLDLLLTQALSELGICCTVHILISDRVTDDDMKCFR